jgi:hypothetical protein
MKKTILIIVMAASFASCKKNAAKPMGSTTGGPCSTPDTTTPVCVLNIIANLQQQQPFNPRAVVNEYYYLGQRVFYVSSDCCDQYNSLYDAHCNILCAPDGGITGHGNGLCSDFYHTAVFQRQVWADPR